MLAFGIVVAVLGCVAAGAVAEWWAWREMQRSIPQPPWTDGTD